jgi:hypothetical protein
MASRPCQENELFCTNGGNLNGNSLNGTSLIEGYCLERHLFSCKLFPACECPQIRPDPDIAGIGVSFVLKDLAVAKANDAR